MSLLSVHRKPKIRALHGSQLQHYLGSFRDSDVSQLRREQSPAANSQSGNSPSPVRRSTSSVSVQASSHRKRKGPLSSSELQAPSSHVVSATIKVYANVLHPDVLYKTAHVSHSTAAADVVRELIDRYAVNVEDKDPTRFCLVEAGNGASQIRMLQDDERPLSIQAEWLNDTYCFRLCRRPDYQGSLEDAPVHYKGEMSVTLTTPFQGTYSSIKVDFDDETTASLLLEQALLEYDVSLDPVLFCLHEMWIEEPSRRTKKRQLHDSELIVNVMPRVAIGRVTLHLRKKTIRKEKVRVRHPSSESTTSVATQASSVGSYGDLSRGPSPSPDYLAVANFDCDWEQRYDEKSQKHYYVNKITRESSWINPASFRQPNMDPDLPFGWERGYDKRSKRIYYINHLTKETTWKNPNKRSADLHSLGGSQGRDMTSISPDSGAYIDTPSPRDETIDIGGKSATKETSPVDRDGDEVFVLQETTSSSNIQSPSDSFQATAQVDPARRDVTLQAVQLGEFEEDSSSCKTESQQTVESSPSGNAEVSSTSDAAATSMFLWTPQPERRGTSPGDESVAFDRSSLFNRSERTRRSARLRGFMLQSLNQGMAGVMQEIAREGRGGLWTPQENRRRIYPQRAKNIHTLSTKARALDTRDMILESGRKAESSLTSQKTEKSDILEDPSRDTVGQTRPDRLTVFRFEGSETAESNRSPEKTRKSPRRLSGGSRSPRDVYKKSVDVQAVKAREELRRLSRGGSPSSSTENETVDSVTVARSYRENTPTARVTPNNHVGGPNTVTSDDHGREDKQSLHTSSTHKTAEGPSHHVGTETSHLPFSDTPQKFQSSVGMSSKIDSSTSQLTPLSASEAGSMSTSNDSRVVPSATVTVDPSGSIIARASSGGKLQAVATTETTEVTTTTEVMEIASSPPKKTRTTTTEKKTLTTAKVIPDELIDQGNKQAPTVLQSRKDDDLVKEDKNGLAASREENELKKTTVASFCVEETSHVVQDTLVEGDDDSFFLQPKTGKEDEVSSNQDVVIESNRTEDVCRRHTSGSESDRSSSLEPEIELFSSNFVEQKESKVTSRNTESDPPSNSSLFTTEDSKSKVNDNCREGRREDARTNNVGDDDIPFISHLNRRRFSASADLESYSINSGCDSSPARTRNSGWRAKLGRLYASNEDDEWVQKRRRGRSLSVTAVLELGEKDGQIDKKELKEETRDHFKGHVKDQASSRERQSNKTPETLAREDRTAKRRSFFEPTRTSSLSVASARKSDVASLKQDTSPKLQLKPHIETKIPSRILAEKQSAKPAMNATASVSTGWTSKPQDGNERKSRPLFDSVATRRQKFEEGEKKRESNLRSKETQQPTDALKTNNSNKLAQEKKVRLETVASNSDEQKNDLQRDGSKSLQTETRESADTQKDVMAGRVSSLDSSTHTMAKDEASTTTSDTVSKQQESGSESRNEYSARRKFFEQRDRRGKPAERSSLPSASVQRSRSFQLRSSWLASPRNASPSTSKKGNVINSEKVGNSAVQGETNRLSPNAKKSPRLGRCSPRTGRSSPKSPKERLKQLEAELEQIESDVYRLLPGQPDQVEVKNEA